MSPIAIRHLGSLGVHAPDRAGDGPYAYKRGQLRKRLELLGMRNGGGAPVHWKIYDEAGAWKEGRLPEFPQSHHDLLADCQAFMFQPVVAYCPFTSDNPGDDFVLLQSRTALEISMEKFMRALPSGTAVIFINEREKTWKGDPATINDLEAVFGFLARKYGMKWYVGADLVTAHTIETINERRAAWRKYHIEPDAIALHSYGQDGTLARHVKDIWDALQRMTGRTWKLVWTEWGWGFPGEGKTREDRRDLETRETGAWCGEFALALAAIQADGCFFTLDQDFNAAGEPTAAAEEFADVVKTGDVYDPRQPPAQKAKEKTRRYLSIGRNALSSFFATRIAN